MHVAPGPLATSAPGAAAAACGIATARQMSRRPAGVITAAPGHGFTPRTRLARARAGSVEAQPAILLLEARRERGRGMPSCGTGTSEPESSSVERPHEDARADLGEPRGQLARRLLGTDRRRLSEQHVARVHARVHLKRRDAGLRLSADDRPGDGAGPAIAREQRGVNVDRPARGRVEHRLRQDLAERRDHRDVGARARPSAPATRDRAAAPAAARGRRPSSARRLTGDGARRCPRPAGRSG